VRDFSNDETRTGWVAGGGIEYMFNRNWTAKIEVLYADFGSSDVTIDAFGGTYTSRFQHWKW
jgi:opacity protein-like surface antigen